MSVQNWLWMLVGFLVLSLGTALGDVYMFRGKVPVVMVGVALIVAGYQLIHYGCHGDGLVRTLSNHEFGGNSTETVLDWARTLVLLVLSVYLIAQGFVIGAQATMQPLRLISMLACGLFIVGGYVAGHIGVHSEVL